MPSLWFDAEHTHAASGVFLLTPDNRVVLQLRDDIPNIDNPGMITTFGGAAEPGEQAVDCALRELAEETGLTPERDALQEIDALSKVDWAGNHTACVFFVLRGIDPASLRVTEGTPITLSFPEIATDSRVTPFCRKLAARIQIDAMR